MIEDTVQAVTKQIRDKISKADVDENVKQLLIELIQFEMRNTCFFLHGKIFLKLSENFITIGKFFFLSTIEISIC